MKDLPLLTVAGVRIGEINEAYFDPFEQRILAFGVNWEETAVIGPDDLIPITQLIELNADIGTVADEIGASAGLDAEPMTATQEGWVTAFASLIDGHVTDEEDRIIGRLGDIHFDPQDGSVQFYEVTAAEDDATLMVGPHPGVDVRDGALILLATSIETARHRKPRLGVAFLEAEGDEDRVGEDDLEVSRVAGTQPDM